MKAKERIILLSVRRTQVLNALVDEHVLTTLPVSSSVLAKRYLPGVSPATIRSELLGLEHLGMVFSPHTSAGRIPTNQGYRFFVNHLLLRPLSLLAANPTIELDTNVETLNETLTLSTIGYASIRQTLEGLSRTTGLLALYCDPEDQFGLTVRGLSRLITQPEFSDSTRLLPLMSLIEDQDDLIQMMENSLESTDLSILIGLEQTGVLAGYTLLSHRVEGQKAIIGLLGPTRMEYRRALAALDSVARLNLGAMRV